MDPALKKEFSEKYGVEVNEVNFDNLEAMVDQARVGAQYDLIWPSTEYVARLAARACSPSSTATLLRNADGISNFYDEAWWDPNNEYSVPYTYYTTGIAWRDDEVSGMTGSWNDLLNPDGDGRMFILDDFQEAIGEANLINGFDLNTEIPEELEVSKADPARAEGARPRVLHQLRPEPGQRHRRHPPGLERRHRQRPQPGRRARALPVRDLRRGGAGRHRLDVHPGQRPQPGHRDAVHGLDHRSRELRPQRALERLPAARATGPSEQFAELVKDAPSIDVDLEALADSALEYRLDDPEARRLWTDVFTEVKAS